MASQYDPTTFGWQNFYSAVLQSDITSGSLTLTLDTVPASTSGILVIEPDSSSNREVILYTSKGASTITCPADGRGWAGSTAVAHLTGSTLIMADVSSYFSGLSDGTLSADPLRTAIFFDHVVSGGAVAQSSGLIGTFSNIVFYLNGRRYSGTSIANKTYTASKDTYVDITGNSDGSVTVLYTEVANNAASPALTTNYLRIAIVVTSGSAITLVNQGSPAATGPTVSSVVLAVCDNLGNLIYPTDPQRKILGYRQIIANIGGVTSSTYAQATGLSVPVIIPAGRKVRVTAQFAGYNNSVTGAGFIGIYEGAVTTAANQIAEQIGQDASAETSFAPPVTRTYLPASTSLTYNVGIKVSTGTGTFYAQTNSGSGTAPAYIQVELV